MVNGLTLRAVNHVQITIPKGEEAVAREFYCKLLGLREIPKPESLRARGGFWLELGAMQIHVGVEDGVERTRTKAHLAYEVNDLQGWLARLRERGIATFDNVPIPGFDRFQFLDPFGNRVEFVGRI